jgi:hypothetical protein
MYGGEWSASRPGHFTPRERPPGTHWIGGWLGPRAGLHAIEKGKISCPFRKSKPGHSARSSSPYERRYHGSLEEYIEELCASRIKFKFHNSHLQYRLSTSPASTPFPIWKDAKQKNHEILSSQFFPPCTVAALT